MKVWVLGAGFSRRLGGPLLNELLSQMSLSTLRQRHPKTWLEESVCDYCVLGLREGMARGWWTNAEEYISALGSQDETHAHNLDEILRRLSLPGPAYHELRELETGDSFSTPAERLALNCWTAAIRIVAAQCMDFLERARFDPEGWLCYDRWSRSLAAEDVIISFNYDELVEQVFLRNKRRLRVPNPRRGEVPERYEGDQLLLKLHGGVSVRDTILHPPEPDSIANLQRNPAMIAVPGRSKSDSCMTEYDALWELAGQALRNCESLSIVGYSCPPSDEMAKALLIDGLAANRNTPSVDLVLGYDTAAATRLAALLDGLAPVRNTNLFAQDYLSLCGRNQGWQVSDVFPGDFPKDDADEE